MEYLLWIAVVLGACGLALFVSGIVCAFWNKDDSGENK